jgi:hypothetical protein
VVLDEIKAISLTATPFTAGVGASDRSQFFLLNEILKTRLPAVQKTHTPATPGSDPFEMYSSMATISPCRCVPTSSTMSLWWSLCFTLSSLSLARPPMIGVNDDRCEESNQAHKYYEPGNENTPQNQHLLSNSMRNIGRKSRVFL